MAKYFVNLTHNQTPVEGWTASVARAYTAKNAPNEVAIGESIIYPSKENAWESIQSHVQKLDYEQDEIWFNHRPVRSYEEVLTGVDNL